MKKNNFITEISESDFRKLNIKVWYMENHEKRYENINDMLDEALDIIKGSEFDTDKESLKYPITLAIHIDDGFYLDKILNMYTGPQSFQIGFGIKHIYVTRDYYEVRDRKDYWRVKKNETKAIYRIHLGE